MKISKRWERMRPVYEFFAREISGLDFSDEAALSAYSAESRGTDLDDPKNGFAYGKAQLNLTVAMWRHDIIHKTLIAAELYEDEDLRPFHWWLDRALNGLVQPGMTLMNRYIPKT